MDDLDGYDNPDVPDVPEGENGNNVSFPPPKANVNALYKYDFTVNNWTITELCQIKLTIQQIAKKAVLGFEVGECGTPHIQGCIFLKVKLRITELTKKSGFERASCRAIRNDVACIAYCQKPETSVAESWSFGFPKPIKILEKLYDWQQKIVDIYETEPDDRCVYWFWEDEGNIGKSAFIKYMIVKYGILFCSGGKYTDIMNLVFNQDMNNCKAVMFNIPRAHEGHISYSSLESIKDGMVCNTKYETGVKVFNSPHLFIFANFPPDKEEMLSKDRWKIIEL